MITLLNPKFTFENKFCRISRKKKIQCKFCRRPPAAPPTAGPTATRCGVAARRADLAIAKSGLKIKRKEGFSIIEAAIALGILTFVLSGTFAVFTRGAAASRKTRDSLVMYNLARQALEQYSDWAVIPANGTYVLPAVTMNNFTYNRSLTVANGPCASCIPCIPSNNYLKVVSVTVSVTPGIATFTLSTLKANY